MPMPIEEQIELMRDRFVTRTVGVLDRASDSLESPIERALFWAFISDANHLQWAGESVAWSVSDPGATSSGKFSVHLGRDDIQISFIPQLPVRCAGGENYRLDFAVTARRRDPRYGIDPDAGPFMSVSIDVECDGHDFHERTKEQAARDKARDQNLQGIGWAVARFTGAEIFADPVGVAMRVRSFAHCLLDLKAKG